MKSFARPASFSFRFKGKASYTPIPTAANPGRGTATPVPTVEKAVDTDQSSGNAARLKLKETIAPSRNARTLKSQDSEDSAPQSPLERCLNTSRLRLFNLSSKIVRSTSGAVTVILVILHGLVFLQDLSFPLSPTVDGGFVWGDSPYVSIFSQALAYLSLGATASISSSIQGLVLVLSIIWVVLYILLFGWSLVALGAEGSSKATWLTRIFSFMTALSRTIFFIPCVGGLLSILTCYSSTTGPSLDSKVFSDTLSPWSFNSWSITSLGCFEGGHVALVVLFSLVAFAFVTVVFIMELIVADRTPVYHRQHLFRKVSSRSEAFILLGRFLLCLIFALRPYLHAGVLLGFSVLQHVFMLSALLHVLPYYAPFTNRLFTTFAAMLGWGSLSSIFSLIVNMPSSESPAYVLYFGLPIAGFAGYTACSLKFQSFDFTTDITTARQVELKARRILWVAIARVDTRIWDVFEQRGRRQTQKDLREYLSNYPAIVEVLGDIADLFEEAMSHFGSSYVVHTAAANFFGFLHGNRHLEGIHLSLAEAMNPPIDYASWLFHRRLQLKEEQHGSLSTHTSVTMRMQFDKQTVVAANASMVARNCVYEFWEELGSHQPSQKRLVSIGKRFSEAMLKADKEYKDLLAINPHSVATIRSYAKFLMEVVNDRKRANELLVEADELEDERSKESRHVAKHLELFARVADLDVTDEGLGIIKSSMDWGNVGAITYANSAALRMFGYTRRELLEQDVSALIPEPIGRIHQGFLNKFMETGEETFMGTTRSLLVMKKSGEMFPCLMTITNMQDMFGALFQPLNTSDNFIIFTGDELMATGATAGSLQMLGRTASQVNGGMVCISQHFPQLRELIASAAEGDRDSSNLPIVDEAGNRAIVLTSPAEMYERQLQLSGLPLVSMMEDTGGSVLHGYAVQAKVQILPFSSKLVSQQRRRRGSVVGGRGERSDSVGKRSRHNRLVSFHKSHFTIERICVLRWRPSPEASSYYKSSESRNPHSSHSQDPAMSPVSTKSESKHSDYGSPAIVKTKKERPPRHRNVAFQGVSDSQETPRSARRSSVGSGQYKTEEFLASILDDEQKAGPELDGPSAEAASHHPLESNASFNPLNRLPKALSSDENDAGGTVYTFHTNQLPVEGEDKDAKEGGFHHSLSFDSVEPPSQDGDGHASPRAKRAEPKVRKGGGSVGTHSTASSGMSVLRSYVNHSHNRTLEPALRSLKFTVIGVLLLAAVLGMGLAVLDRVQLASFEDDLKSMELSSRREFYLTDVVLHLQDLNLLYLQDLPIDPSLFSVVQKEIEDVAFRLEEAHEELYLNAPEAELNYYQNTEFQIRRRVGGVPGFHKGVLFDVLQEYIAAAKEVSRLTYEEYEPNHDSAWFLFNNVYSTFSACDKATDLVVARHEEALAVSETISAAVFLGVGCLVVLVSFAVVIPMVWGVDTLRSKILDLFMDVPVVVVRKLKTMARNQLDDLEAELEDDDDMRREAATTVGDGIEEGLKNWENLQLTLGSGKRNRERQSKRSWALLAKLLLIFCFPLMLTVMYYLAAFLWHDADTARIYAAGKRMSLAEERAPHMLMSTYYVTQQVWLDNVTYNHEVLDPLFYSIVTANQYAADINSWVTDFHEAVLHSQNVMTKGSADMSSILGDSDRITEIQLRNACSAFYNLKGTLTRTKALDCEGFMKGLLKNGLDTALRTYLKTADDIMIRRNARTGIMASSNATQRLVDSGWTQFRILAHDYLNPILRTTSTEHLGFCESLISTYVVGFTMVAVVFILANILVYLFLYRRQLYALDLEIKQMRSWLMLFPPEIIRGVPSINDAINKVTGRKINVRT